MTALIGTPKAHSHQTWPERPLFYMLWGSGLLRPPTSGGLGSRSAGSVSSLAHLLKQQQTVPFNHKSPAQLSDFHEGVGCYY